MPSNLHGKLEPSGFNGELLGLPNGLGFSRIMWAEATEEKARTAAAMA